MRGIAFALVMLLACALPAQATSAQKIDPDVADAQKKRLFALYEQVLVGYRKMYQRADPEFVLSEEEPISLATANEFANNGIGRVVFYTIYANKFSDSAIRALLAHELAHIGECHLFHKVWWKINTYELEGHATPGADKSRLELMAQGINHQSEFEADAMGYAMLQKAGFNSQNAHISLLGPIQRLLKEDCDIPTHPRLSARIHALGLLDHPLFGPALKKARADCPAADVASMDANHKLVVSD